MDRQTYLNDKNFPLQLTFKLLGGALVCLIGLQITGIYKQGKEKKGVSVKY